MDTLNKIAKEILHLETLETRNSDGLDFKEQAVFELGTRQGIKFEKEERKRKFEKDVQKQTSGLSMTTILHKRRKRIN